MPFIIPFIPLIAAGVTGGISLGETLSNQPGAPPPVPTTPSGPQPQGVQTDAAQRVAASQTFPNIQAAGGGSFAPEYYAQTAGSQTGLGNNPQASGNLQAALNQFFGLGAPGTTGLSTTGVAPTTSGNSITDLLASLKAPSTGGGGGGSIVDSALSSDVFHGFSG